MRVVILGAGVSGHTAALLLRKKLPKAHDVVVVTPNSKWNWIPSNIWGGVGVMKPKDVTFELAPVYAKKGITYVSAMILKSHDTKLTHAATPAPRALPLPDQGS